MARKFGKGKAKAVFADVRDGKHLAKLLHGSSIVLNCTQYNWNLDVMRAAIAANIHYMDLGGLYHVTKKQFALDKDFRRIGKLAIPGMGGAPGITNVMARTLADPMDRVDAIKVFNAGADVQKYDSPIAYSFSIATILDELTMAPIHFVGGKYVAKPMLSEPEPGTFPPPIGKIELRHAIPLRARHARRKLPQKGREGSVFQDQLRPKAGLACTQPRRSGIHFDGAGRCSRHDNRAERRASLLMQKKAPRKPPLDVEALRVVVTGRADNKRLGSAMEMWADNTTRPQLSAVARDTGFPLAIAAVMHGRGEIPGAGVQAPEEVVPPEPFFRELKKRGFTFKRWSVKP